MVKKFFLVLLLLIGGVYLYLFPIQKYIAKQNLYSFLYKQDGVKKSDVTIIGTWRDIKTTRGGVIIRIKVIGSSYEYVYDYSFKEENWQMTYYNFKYEEKGSGYFWEQKDQHILFDEK